MIRIGMMNYSQTETILCLFLERRYISSVWTLGVCVCVCVQVYLVVRSLFVPKSLPQSQLNQQRKWFSVVYKLVEILLTQSLCVSRMCRNFVPSCIGDVARRQLGLN